MAKRYSENINLTEEDSKKDGRTGDLGLEKFMRKRIQWSKNEVKEPQAIEQRSHKIRQKKNQLHLVTKYVR